MSGFPDANPLGLPRYFLVWDVPGKLVQTNDGGIEFLLFDRQSGRLEPAPDLIADALSRREGIEPISEAEFEAELRSRRP